MSDEKSPDELPHIPGLYANFFLMLGVGVALVIFLVVTKSCSNSSNKKLAAAQADAAAKKETETDPAKPGFSAAVASKPYTGKQVPVPNEKRVVATLPVVKPVIVPDGAVAEDAQPAPEAAHEVATNSPEGAAMLKDAIARIDEAPADVYPEKAKAKVREGLQSARRIFKVGTVYFEKGGAKLLPRDKEYLTKALKTPSIQEASSDPRAVYFVLGFADKSGDANTNKKLSFQRADAVIGTMENDIEVFNLIYPVAIGSTELVSPENQQKNRATEVWLVLP